MELNDALPDIQGTLFHDTIHCRELPGDGFFEVPAFLHALHDAGHKGPYGVENLSDKHRQLPLLEQASQSFEATMKQFEILELRLQAG